MNKKLFITSTVLAAVSGGMVFMTGCQTEEPMPPGVYIRPVEKDPERVEVPKQTPAPAPVDPGLEPAPVPPPAPAPAPVPAARKAAPAKRPPRKAEFRKEPVEYIVKKNDNLSTIAHRYGVKVGELKKYNHLKKDVIHPKQRLMIPPTNETAGSAPEKAAVKDAPKGKSAAPAGRKGRKSAAIPADGIHKVRPRENFTTIARMYGITVADLVVANPGVNSAKLKVGQSLKIVAGAGKSAQGELALPPARNEKKAVKAPEKKGVKAPEKKAAPSKAKEGQSLPAEKKESKKSAAPAKAKGGTAAALDDDNLFSGIQSPEEAASSPAKPAASPAPAAAPAAASTDALSDDLSDTPGVKEDKILNTPDGKMKIIPAKDTTLEQVATKYATTLEALRKENPGLPASGTIKAGTEILVEK